MKKSLIQNFAGLSILIFFGILLNQRVNAASFDFSPATANFVRGCTNEVIVYADATGQNSNAADIEINYNSADLNIVDAMSSVSGTQVAIGDAYGGYVYDQVNTGSGIIKVAAGSSIGELTSKKTFIKIDFIANALASSDSFTINFTGSGDTLDSNIADSSTSEDLLTSVTNANYTFSAGTCPTVIPTATPIPTVAPTSNVVTTQVVVNGTPTVVILTPTPISSLPQTGSIINFNAELFFNIINTQVFANTTLAQLGLDLLALLPLIALAFLLMYLPLLNPVGKHYWGVIFDRNTKKAVVMAQISLYDSSTKKLIGKVVSDFKGRFGFMVGEGSYQIIAKLDGYEDVKEEVTLPKIADFFSKDIAMSLRKHNNLISSLKIFSRRISTYIYESIPVMLLGGLVIGGLANMLAFNFFSLAILVAYLFMAILYMIVRLSKHETTGKVIDIKSKSVVKGAIIKIFNPQKQLEDTMLSNHDGSYAFDLIAGNYTARVVAEGYQQPANSNSTFNVGEGVKVQNNLMLDRRV